MLKQKNHAKLLTMSLSIIPSLHFLIKQNTKKCNVCPFSHYVKIYNMYHTYLYSGLCEIYLHRNFLSSINVRVMSLLKSPF